MKSTAISESRLLGYKQTLELAKKQLVTLHGDTRKDPDDYFFKDRVQDGLLDVIDLILTDMESVMKTMKDPVDDSSNALIR